MDLVADAVEGGDRKGDDEIAIRRPLREEVGEQRGQQSVGGDVRYFWANTWAAPWATWGAAGWSEKR